MSFHKCIVNAPLLGSAFFRVFMLSAMNVYLDESGDLGWVLNKPYQHGGSSKYLTIAFVVCPSEKKHLLKRIVRSVYNKTKTDPKIELKGSAMSERAKCFFANEVSNLISVNPDIRLVAITVNKSKVQQHIREDSNKLYNYMIGLAVLPVVKNEPLVNLIRDNKSVKVKSGSSLIDYLQTELWFDLQTKTRIVDMPSDSKQVQNLVFIDWVNNIVWGHYEKNVDEPYDILKKVLEVKHLFF